MPNSKNQPILADLFELPQRLEISCYGCARDTIRLTPEEAVAKYGAEMTFARLRTILTCSECGARGRDRKIDARASTSDYYDALARKRHRDEVEAYGQEEADRIEAHRRRQSPSAH